MCWKSWVADQQERYCVPGGPPFSKPLWEGNVQWSPKGVEGHCFHITLSNHQNVCSQTPRAACSGSVTLRLRSKWWRLMMKKSFEGADMNLTSSLGFWVTCFGWCDMWKISRSLTSVFFFMVFQFQDARLDHPHLVKALDFLQFDFQAAVVLSYHPGQTLDVAVKGRTFPERTARQLFCQLMSAIGYLHEQGVLHRDVKAENILVSPDHQSLHLADFNAASDAGALTMTGTMEYSAPEVLDGNSPSYGQDVWGCGLCLHMMLAGGLPRRLHNSRSLEAFACAQRACPVKWERLKGCSPTCKAVISQCLCVEERSRPSAAEILRMRWILDISDV